MFEYKQSKLAGPFNNVSIPLHIPSIHDLRNTELRPPVPLDETGQSGVYTIDGQYIPPRNFSKSKKMISCLYICAGEHIKSILDPNNSVKLASDTKLFYTTDIHGLVNGCQLKIKNLNTNDNYYLESVTQSSEKPEFSIPTGFSKLSAYDVVEQKSSHKKTDSNSKLENGKLYVNDISFYLNGFVVNAAGLQEIILEKGTILRIVEFEVFMLDESSEWVSVVPSNMTFKFDSTNYIEPKKIKDVTPTDYYLNNQNNITNPNNVTNSTDELKKIILNLSKAIINNFDTTKHTLKQNNTTEKPKFIKEPTSNPVFREHGSTQNVRFSNDTPNPSARVFPFNHFENFNNFNNVDNFNNFDSTTNQGLSIARNGSNLSGDGNKGLQNYFTGGYVSSGIPGNWANSMTILDSPGTTSTLTYQILGGGNFNYGNNMATPLVAIEILQNA
jgi:hypothetical protein